MAQRPNVGRAHDYFIYLWVTGIDQETIIWFEEKLWKQ